jgi:putative transposase
MGNSGGVMKGKRYTEQQILDILGQVDAGQPLAEITRLHGVAASTIHRWKNRYGSMTKDETKRPSSVGRRESTTQETGR